MSDQETAAPEWVPRGDYVQPTRDVLTAVEAGLLKRPAS